MRPARPTGQGERLSCRARLADSQIVDALERRPAVAADDRGAVAAHQGIVAGLLALRTIVFGAGWHGAGKAYGAVSSLTAPSRPPAPSRARMGPRAFRKISY